MQFTISHLSDNENSYDNKKRNSYIFYNNKKTAARAGARTLDIVVKSHTLYRLSYPGVLFFYDYCLSIGYVIVTTKEFSAI
jgi:hypothetical protein